VAADRFVFLDNVNFINKGWINRNNILVGGKASLFTIPLSNGSQNEFIQNVKIADVQTWRLKFLKTLEMNYKKAPYYSAAIEIIDKTMDLKTEGISVWAEDSIKNVADYLGVKVQFSRSSELPDVEGKGEERILAINKFYHSDLYINPPGGKELYHSEKFKNIGVDLKFIEMHKSEYPQGKFPFVPYLSMIDVLMWNSVDEINTMLSKYILVNG
jgi:hypothetical protein